MHVLFGVVAGPIGFLKQDCRIKRLARGSAFKFVTMRQVESAH